MSDRKPLMPKATAVWLVENTSLTFEQIAEFCGLHVLEVKGIADGDVAQGIKGMDPVTTGQLTREEIERGRGGPRRIACSSPSQGRHPRGRRPSKGPRYTPVSRRQDRPNAVLWLLRNHPELKDSQIMRLVGTTKPTIAADPRPHALELAQPDAAGPGDARPVLADRPRRRGEEGGAPPRARAQGAAARGWRRPARCCRPRETTCRPAWVRSPTVEIMAPKPSRRSARRPSAEEQARVFAKLREMGGGQDRGETQTAPACIRAATRRLQSLEAR